MIKGLTSIFLSLVFLLSGTGFHLDLEYCCGNLERIGLFDNLSIGLEDCCEGEPIHDGCMDSDHVVKEMEAQEFLSFATLKFDKLPSFELPTFLVLSQPQVAAEVQILQIQFAHSLPPPDLVMLQTFLC